MGWGRLGSPCSEAAHGTLKPPHPSWEQGLNFPAGLGSLFFEVTGCQRGCKHRGVSQRHLDGNRDKQRPVFGEESAVLSWLHGCYVWQAPPGVTTRLAEPHFGIDLRWSRSWWHLVAGAGQTRIPSLPFQWCCFLTRAKSDCFPRFCRDKTLLRYLCAEAGSCPWHHPCLCLAAWV